MEEHSFRVWNKEEENYSTDWFVLSMEGELNIVIGRGLQKADPKRYIVERCIGLRDENGKLIFEGDKVNMTVFYFDGKEKAEQHFFGYVWNKGEFVLSQNPKKLEYENDTDTIPHLSWGDSFKIIGNIHEAV